MHGVKNILMSPRRLMSLRSALRI